MVVMAIPKRATPDRTSATMAIVRVESRRGAEAAGASHCGGPGWGDQAVRHRLLGRPGLRGRRLGARPPARSPPGVSWRESGTRADSAPRIRALV